MNGGVHMIHINDFLCPTDSETLECAMANRTSDGILVISPRVSDIEPERDYWLIDRAINFRRYIL